MDILFIEDDRQYADDFIKIVSVLQPEWKIKWASGVSEAIKDFENYATFNIIILDIMMPAEKPPFTLEEMKQSDKGLDSGLILLDKIKQLQNNDVKIIVVSARKDLPKEITEKIDVSLYFNKPIQTTEIVNNIQTLFSK
ncbi:MAG TPA: response regulator [Bacteroidales bacterium]|nr:response regulator [Bacteroidales bacterium]